MRLRWSMISWSTDGQRSLWRIFHRRRGSLGVSYNVFPFRFSFSIIQYASSLVWRQSVDRLYFLSEGEDLDFDEMWTIDWRITEILTNFFLSNAMDRKKFTPILFLYIKVSWLFECIRKAWKGSASCEANCTPRSNTGISYRLTGDREYGCTRCVIIAMGRQSCAPDQ